MLNETLVRGIIAVMMIFPLAWDWSVAMTGHGDLTISAVFRRWAAEAPILPFLFGLICGHVVWFGILAANGGQPPPK